MDRLTPDFEWERDIEEKLDDVNSKITMEAEEIAYENIEDEFERLRPLYLNWIEDYCNVTFDEARLPGSVGLALDELVKTDPKKFAVTSEKLSDMAVTYGEGGTSGFGANGAIPHYIRAWLEPYRRVHLLDKKKRPYNDGRR